MNPYARSAFLLISFATGISDAQALTALERQLVGSAPTFAPSTALTLAAPFPAIGYGDTGSSATSIPAREHGREGWLFGLGLGGGRVQDKVTGLGGLAFDLHGGEALSSDFALVLSAAGLVHSESDGGSLSDYGLALSAEGRLIDRIRASIGGGYYGLTRTGAKDANGNGSSVTVGSAGGEAGLGVELFQTESGFSTGLFLKDQLSFPNGKWVDSTFAVIGVRWSGIGSPAQERVPTPPNAPPPLTPVTSVVPDAARPAPSAAAFVCTAPDRASSDISLPPGNVSTLKFASTLGADWAAYIASSQGGRGLSTPVSVAANGHVAIPDATWIWRQTQNGESGRMQAAIFEKTFVLDGAPKAGVISLAARDFAEVFVNHQPVGCVGSATDQYSAGRNATAPTTFDLTPYLDKVMTITILVQNGGAVCEAASGSECNDTGGVVFRGELAYEPPTPTPPTPEGSAPASGWDEFVEQYEEAVDDLAYFIQKKWLNSEGSSCKAKLTTGVKNIQQILEVTKQGNDWVEDVQTALGYKPSKTQKSLNKLMAVVDNPFLRALAKFTAPKIAEALCDKRRSDEAAPRMKQ